MRRLILLALTSGLLSACAIGPDYQRDTPPLPEAPEITVKQSGRISRLMSTSA